MYYQKVKKLMKKGKQNRRLGVILGRRIRERKRKEK